MCVCVCVCVHICFYVFIYLIICLFICMCVGTVCIYDYAYNIKHVCTRAYARPLLLRNSALL